MVVAATTLTNEQQAAADAIDAFIRNGRGSRILTINGPAGTGKTTLLGHVAQSFPHVLVAAPTGKAAAVLRGKFGLPARTIHSLFYKLQDRQQDKPGREVLNFVPRHTQGALSTEVLLIDELSMVTAEMRDQLLGLGLRIVGFGDDAQVPPVNGEPGFIYPDITLTQIHRQAKHSPIIRQAHRVRAGHGYQSDGDEFLVVPKGTGEMLRQADIVLCHRNDSRRFLNQHCRRVRGIIRHPADPSGGFDPQIDHPRQFEPVVVLRNAPRFGLWNGDVQWLDDDIRPGDRTASLFKVSESGGSAGGVTYPLSAIEGMSGTGGAPGGLELAFGYCLTAHRAQGSEWPSVLVHDEFCGPDGERRSWLYTAITRARERVIIVSRNHRDEG